MVYSINAEFLGVSKKGFAKTLNQHVWKESPGEPGMAHSKLRECTERTVRAPAGVSWILHLNFEHIYPYFRATWSLVRLTPLCLTGFQGKRVSGFTSAVSSPIQRKRRREAEAVWTQVPSPEGTRLESCRAGALQGWQQGQVGPQCQGPAGLWLRMVET